jgi:hypothetical protein
MIIMIPNINGYYLGMGSYGLASTNIPTVALNDSKMRKKELLDEIKQNFNQPSQHIPVNTVAKSVENAANKEDFDQTANSLPDNIASLISLIESSRTIENNLDEMCKILSSLPQSQGQLMMMSTDSSNTAKDGLVNELVQNFSNIDTNKDNLISYNEVLAFLNRS